MTTIVLKPFLETTTYRNVLATGAAVVNLTDDVRVFARAAISNPQYPTRPAAVVRGVVLADCCSWREIEVRSIDSTPPRSRVETAVVHHGTRRDFIGFNRASHAVLEAAIYATRVHLLPRAFIDSELARLQVIVDKTASARELEAMALLTDYVRAAPRRFVHFCTGSGAGRAVTTGGHEDAVFVEAPARLHFGVLDLRGSLGRWFGGIGAAAPAPTLLVSAEQADTLEVHGEDADRAVEFASRFLSHHDIGRGARVRVHRALPAHAGLGSGTQLALAVARALAELHGVSTDAPSLARAVGRGRRSAIGTWIFAAGGLVVEGGRRPDRDECGPLLARLPFPAAWRCIVAVPHGRPGISGGAEEEALRAAATAVGARRRARLARRPDGAAPGAGRGRSHDVRRRADRNPGNDRAMVCAGAGRYVRARPERRPGAADGRVGRVWRRAELVGPGGLWRRRRRRCRPPARRARPCRVGHGRHGVRRAVPDLRRPRLARAPGGQRLFRVLLRV